VKAPRQLAAATAAAIALGSLSCGTDDPPEARPAESRFHARGASVVIPHGWTATRRPTSTILDPRTLFTAASFDLDPVRPRSCSPTEVLRQKPPDGALIVVSRYGRDHGRLSDIPRRPESFSLSAENRGSFECSGRSYALHFREGGRGYGVNVWLDPRTADPDTRREAEDLLDGMELTATD